MQRRRRSTAAAPPTFANNFHSPAPPPPLSKVLSEDYLPSIHPELRPSHLESAVETSQEAFHLLFLS